MSELRACVADASMAFLNSSLISSLLASNSSRILRIAHDERHQRQVSACTDTRMWPLAALLWHCVVPSGLASLCWLSTHPESTHLTLVLWTIMLSTHPAARRPFLVACAVLCCAVLCCAV